VKAFGMTIARVGGAWVVGRTKSIISALTARDVYGVVREPFTGAWQRNLECDNRACVLAFSAVYSCVSIVSSDIGKLPCNLTQRQENGIWKPAPANSPFWIPLRKPNRYQTRIQFFTQWVISLMLFGNTYVLKERDKRGVVTNLYVLRGDMAMPCVAEDGSIWYQLASNCLAGIPDGVRIPASEIIHDRINCLWHPLVGVSPIYACGASATQGNRIQAQSAKFFENMSRPSGMLTAPAQIDDETAARLKTQFEQALGGTNIGRLLVAGNGLKYEAMTMPATDAQLIEQLKWTVEDVARCFIPGTEIITSNGIKAIEDVVVGDMVLTHKGRWRRVYETLKNDYVGPVVRMRAKGLKEITSTGNHPFLVQTAKPNRTHSIEAMGDAEWMRADQLIAAPRLGNGVRSRRPFHNLVMPRLRNSTTEIVDVALWAPEGANIEADRVRASMNHRATWVNRHIKADYDLGWLCGLFAADGTASDHQVSFYIGEHESDITALLESRISSVFGARSDTKTARAVTRTTISNLVVTGFFKQFGVGAHNKAMPEWCMAQSAEFLAGVIDGLVDGDGCVDGDRTVLKMVSKTAIWQARVILWAQGINSSMQTVAEAAYEINGSSGMNREIYQLQWRHDSNRRGSMGLTEELAFFSLDEAEKSMYSGPVYNLEVEDDHSYTTVGGVAHNCFRVPLYMLDAGPIPGDKNIEAMQRMYYTQTLQAIMEGIELLLDEGFDLPSDQGTEFDLSPLLRMDTQARYATYQTGVQSMVLAPNEARLMENLAPVEGGDEPLSQQQYWPLSILAERSPPGVVEVTPVTPTAEAPPAPADEADEEGKALTSYDIIARTNEYIERALAAEGA